LRFLAALRFLTIVPLPFWRQAKEEEIGRSLGYFPVVGAIIGLILAGVDWVLRLFLPHPVVIGLLVVSLVAMTGALHLDGFIDTCDGLGGHRTMEDRWRVMHDSRAGAFGIVGAVLLLLVKYVSLNSVPENLLLATLAAVPVVSRWAMVYAVFAYPYARPSGLGKLLKETARWPDLAMATAITLVAVTGLARWANLAHFYVAGLALMFGTWVIASGVAAYLSRKFAGLTGDTYGAINEITELVTLLFVCLVAFRGWL
jgi:adenosylcobinamide-GDP ribazoletransferase